MAESENKSEVNDQKELKNSIKKQIEYYFSVENLLKDSYLISKMDPELFVPINVISSFSKLKALTEDENLMADVINESELLDLDESKTKVKPKMQQKRNTVILRDMPSSTTKEVLDSLFNEGGYKDKITSLKPDIGNTWFATFTEEEDALAALDFIRKQQIDNQYIKARLKSENLFKTFYQQYQAENLQPAPDNVNGEKYVPNAYPVNLMNYQAPNVTYYHYNPNYNYNELVPNSNPYWNVYNNNNVNNSQRNSNNPDNRKYSNRGGRKNYRKGNHNKKKKNQYNKKKNNNQRKNNQPQDLKLSEPSQFPPLPSNSNANSSGYKKKNFIQYSTEQIITVVKDIKDVSKPEDIPEANPPILSKPNTDLIIDKPKPVENDENDNVVIPSHKKKKNSNNSKKKTWSQVVTKKKNEPAKNLDKKSDPPLSSNTNQPNKKKKNQSDN
eukprot:TRINITY_DN15143_c0_g1_i1.p1 TRINITY_DN15143_c0_g1~~TRINITY_DN15143_c0_g1_i1.p1  ORF type:complete len:442 (+),score=147.69 TRINITY_DN15143_c0_g1_i1:96-1421(+)